MNSEQVLAMIAEYNPRPAVPKATRPELGATAMMPSPAAIIAEVEAAVAGDLSTWARSAPEPTVEPLPVNVPRPHPKRARRKDAPSAACLSDAGNRRGAENGKSRAWRRDEQSAAQRPAGDASGRSGW